MGVPRSRTVHEERGATVVIVILSLFALFGMIVLVVDVGGLLYARRGMVNASDAAALAAAQSCIGVVEDAEAFADQYDNAQRMHELGYGVRLATYGFADEELVEAVEGLIADEGLRSSLDALGDRIRDTHGARRAADLIEDLGRRRREGHHA